MCFCDTCFVLVMLQEGLFDCRIDDLGKNLAQEPFGISFLVQHEEIQKLVGWGLPRAARGNSEMSWMGLVSPAAT